jgi:Cu+-exporting ATPase
MVGTGVAAQHGILFKDAATLQLAQKVKTVVFDKTGTLTEGRPRLLSVQVIDGVSEDAALKWAAALHMNSSHPLAKAVIDSIHQRGWVVSQAQNVESVSGKGMLGQVQGVALALGSERWMNELGPIMDMPLRTTSFGEAAARLQDKGATVSVLVERTLQGVVPLAVLAFGDEPKPGVQDSLAKLRARGLRLVMISGDNAGSAQVMAARLGLHPDEVHAEVMPGDKAALVKSLQHNPHGAAHVVAFVGDGINDAPALAAADVGLAMANLNADGQRGGTDVAMQAAGITLMRGDVALVAGALDISARTVARIRQNLFWAFVFNAAGIPLAASGWLTPVLAGMAMSMSSRMLPAGTEGWTATRFGMVTSSDTGAKSFTGS